VARSAALGSRRLLSVASRLQPAELSIDEEFAKLPDEVKKILQDKAVAFGQVLGGYVMDVGATAPRSCRRPGSKARAFASPQQSVGC